MGVYVALWVYKTWSGTSDDGSTDCPSVLTTAAKGKLAISPEVDMWAAQKRKTAEERQWEAWA